MKGFLFIFFKMIFLYINLGYLLIKEGRKEGRKRKFELCMFVSHLEISPYHSQINHRTPSVFFSFGVHFVM
jgi:hypothetical protein